MGLSRASHYVAPFAAHTALSWFSLTLLLRFFKKVGCPLLRATDVWNNHISKKDRQRIQKALIQLATTAEIDNYVTELRQRTIDRLTLRFVGDEWPPPRPHQKSAAKRTQRRGRGRSAFQSQRAGKRAGGPRHSGRGRKTVDLSSEIA